MTEGGNGQQAKEEDKPREGGEGSRAKPPKDELQKMKAEMQAFVQTADHSISQLVTKIQSTETTITSMDRQHREWTSDYKRDQEQMQSALATILSRLPPPREGGERRL